MENYKHILLAIDINAEYENIIRRALNLCQTPDDICLAYVCLPSVYVQPYLYGLEYNTITDTNRVTSAREILEKIAMKFGINKEKIIVNVGKPSDEIKRIADESDIDLIVIGTHGQSGIQLLLGSTANSVLHGVKQDVLTVRLQDTK